MLVLLKRQTIMKARRNLRNIPIFLIMMMIPDFASAGLSQQIKEWFGNQNFSFVEENNLLCVSMNKNPWEAFTLNINNMDLMNNPIINVELATNQDITLRVDISDGIFVSSHASILDRKIAGTGMFYKISYDFSSLLDDVNITKDAFLVFYVNPGKKFTGVLKIKDVEFTSNSDQLSGQLYNNPGELSLFPSPATTFTNVTIPDGDFTSMSILDMTRNTIFKTDVSSFNGTTYRIDLSDFSKGSYFVQIFGSNTTLSNKLIIN